MSRRHITVVGSYATGLTMRVKRIPASGETVLGTGYRVDFGGKGSNQAVGCVRLGAHVDFVAKIGTDSFGEMAMNLYRDEGIGTTAVKRSGKTPTGVGFIVVEEGTGQNCIVLDPGANELLTAADIVENQPLIESSSVVLTQLEIPGDAAAAALESGRRAGATTILNPAPVRPLSPSTLQLVDVLTPNETEAKVLVGLAPDVAIEPREVARELLGRGVKQVVMTLGERGALLVTASSCRHFSALPVEAADTTGAGDAFNAGLATALAHGAILEDAVEFAVIAGAISVTKEGVIPSLPRREEVVRFCRQRGIALPQWLED